MTELPVETHPFPPILPPQATVMMMGTFPPTPEKRCMEFHYPNFQNDMWRIYGLVFFNDKNYFQVKDEKCFDAERIKAFLRERGIASCPTVWKAIREQGNASDKFLQIVEPVPLAKILAQIPQCQWIFTTGGKATEVLFSLVPEKLKEPKTNEWIDFPFAGRELKLYRVPSTSRAYPLSLEKKAEAYRRFFQLAGIL
ncbi:G/U mismatch-specific uracil-DNA glycosylase [Pasteurella langaaensis DSM 22999]|uniref:G/U mismatch-specific uracil-DNA glycosylase n=1 Tax=Alitibacter langaaensis DSM 22999 TaxID=1122935 RepID=A0A2U0TAK5_9PAST|nr:DNA glycosylase [Pasteurella langaaensis]PVX40619.1 G/U mismatch-specific uracil-DNA glycosylase [Pasteurella langaaensis DSM 22999]